MSEQLYRWAGKADPMPRPIQQQIYDGLWVPVERCEHGRVEGHQWWDKDTDHAVWCPGSPTLEVDDE